jgi:hypothetical protein
MPVSFNRLIADKVFSIPVPLSLSKEIVTFLISNAFKPAICFCDSFPWPIATTFFRPKAGKYKASG